MDYEIQFVIAFQENNLTARTKVQHVAKTVGFVKPVVIPGGSGGGPPEVQEQKLSYIIRRKQYSKISI